MNRDALPNLVCVFLIGVTLGAVLMDYLFVHGLIVAARPWLQLGLAFCFIGCQTWGWAKQLGANS